MMSDFTPEPRDIDPELADDYDHADYPPPLTKWNCVEEQIGLANAAALREWVAGGIGNPSWRDTEIGDE